ncbi:MAG TPA: peptidase [Sutterella sp.]|nr:peptidase [Sutterella sp.]
MKSRTKSLVVAALAAVFATGLSTYAPVSSAALFESDKTQLPDFVSLVEKYGKGVVNISTVREARVIEGANPFGELDERQAEIFKRFGFPIFPFVGPQEEPERRGTGSGFIISSDGLILTNHHVIDGADEITVRLTDNREFKGKVLGSDQKTDIAVVKIDAKDLPALKMGDSSKLKVGEWVAAIGSPFGLDNTVTAGIVSAKSRQLPSDQYVPFIQTDVAVNPGNSGGPLFNMAGEVVGINSQIFSTSGGFMGLSFAIPIDLALQIKDQLVSTGKVTRGRIGVVVQSMTQELAESFGMKTPQGALVSQIDKNGPAAKSDLREGDIIVQANGKPIASSGDLPVLVSSMTPGSDLMLTVIRDGKQVSVKVKVGEDSQNSAGNASKKATSDAARLGVSVRSLTAEEADSAGTVGLLVTSSEGAARKAGVQRGDIIVSVNGQAMKKPSDLGAVISKTKTLRLLLQRGQTRIFVPVKLK